MPTVPSDMDDYIPYILQTNLRVNLCDCIFFYGVPTFSARAGWIHRLSTFADRIVIGLFGRRFRPDINKEGLLKSASKGTSETFGATPQIPISLLP